MKTLRAKLIGMCVVVGIILVLAAAAQTWFSSRASQELSLSRRAHAQFEQLGLIQRSLTWQIKETVDLSREGEPNVQYLADREQARKQGERALARLEALALEEMPFLREDEIRSDAQKYEQLRVDLKAISAAGDEILALVRAGQRERVDDFTLEEKVRGTDELLTEMVEEEADEVVLRDRSAMQSSRAATTVAWLAPLLSALVLLGVLLLILRSMTRALGSLAEGGNRMASGDLAVPIPVHSNDELGQLAAAFNDMQRSLAARIAERDRALADARFKTVSEAAPMPIAEIDSGGRILYANQRWLELNGGAHGPDHRWIDLVHAEDRARAETFAGAPDGASTEFRLGGGAEPLWVVARTAPLSHDRSILALADVTAQKKAVTRAEQMSRELMVVSRKAGMAEISAGVLHNVGNVLNSVTVSTKALQELFRGSRAAKLQKGTQLLAEQGAGIAEFLATERGKLLPPYLVQAATLVVEEIAIADRELARIEKGVEHIQVIVNMQQSYAKSKAVTERLSVVDVVEDVMTMNSDSFGRHDIRIVKRFEGNPQIVTDRHKLMQILVNLINNACHAVDDAPLPPEGKRIQVCTRATSQGTVVLEVNDNGVGIDPEIMTRIFEHGFTTRKSGHGFGLHSSALAAEDLGGRLSAHSSGRGLGATFTLELPIGAEEVAA